MDPLAHKVARRFLADIIGNPHQLLQKYDAAVERVSDMEPLLPKMREGQKIAERTPNAEWLAHKGELAPHENELVNLYFKNIYRVVVRVNLDTFHHAEAWSLFLAILQQYDLSPATRKPIEVASKFFARSRIQAPKKPVAIDTYETFLKTLRGFSLAARDALAHGKPRAGGASESDVAPDKVRAGPFTLINTGGFKDSVLADCAKVVEVAAHQLQSHGLGNVCYGDVLISNTLMKSNVLAFYLIQKDEMFVRANLRGKEGAAIQTVVHELGHRLMYKFLSSKHRDIEHIYNTLKSKSSAARAEALIQLLKDPALKPKPGDTFVSKGEEFTVTGLDVNSRGGHGPACNEGTTHREGPDSIGGLCSGEGYPPQDQPFKLRVRLRRDRRRRELRRDGGPLLSGYAPGRPGGDAQVGPLKVFDRRPPPG